MKQVIEQIQAKLHEVSTLKYIDEDWGQLDEYGTLPPVKYPCALIDFEGVQFSNIGNDRAKTPIQRQQGLAQLSIIIADLKITNTSGQAPKLQRQQAHSIWQTIEQVHACLQGYKPTLYSSALIRTGLKRLERDEGVQIYQIIYTVELYNV